MAVAVLGVLVALVVELCCLTAGLTGFFSAPAPVLGVVVVFFDCGTGFFVPMGVLAFAALPVPPAVPALAFAPLGVADAEAEVEPVFAPAPAPVTEPTFFCADPTVPVAFLTGVEAVLPT